MSEAKKCDLCKKLYEESSPDRNVDEKKEYSIGLIVCITVYKDWGRSGDGLDVCDECLNDLAKRFIKSL